MKKKKKKKKSLNMPYKFHNLFGLLVDTQNDDMYSFVKDYM